MKFNQRRVVSAHFRKRLIASALMALLPLPAGVLAQDAAGGEKDNAEETKAQSSAVTLEGLVVTSRKKEELLQVTPITITAIGAAEMAERGVQDLNDISMAKTKATP